LRNRLETPDSSKARETLKKETIRINPKGYKHYVELGNVYIEYGRLDRAEDMYTKAIEINPESRDAYDCVIVSEGDTIRPKSS